MPSSLSSTRAPKSVPHRPHLSRQKSAELASASARVRVQELAALNQRRPELCLSELEERMRSMGLVKIEPTQDKKSRPKDSESDDQLENQSENGLVTKPGQKGQQEEAEDCILCGTEGHLHAVSLDEKCGHSFCIVCVGHLFHMHLEDGKFPARCPVCVVSPGDTTDQAGYMDWKAVESLVGAKILDENTGKRFNNQQMLTAIPSAERHVCNKCGLMSVKGTKTSEASRPICPYCRHQTCVPCGVPWHIGRNCETYQKELKAKRKSQEEKASDTFVLKTTKACPNCGVRTSHWRGHACHHIKPGAFSCRFPILSCLHCLCVSLLCFAFLSFTCLVGRLFMIMYIQRISAVERDGRAASVIITVCTWLPFLAIWTRQAIATG